MTYHIFQADVTQFFEQQPFEKPFDLTFLDPPFNQAKDYAYHDDNLSDEHYWDWMKAICQSIFENTTEGGAIYFMQREKNSEFVLCCLRESGWSLQNLVVWKKLTSAVPSNTRYGKHYQIIAYATKGKKARVFNKLRIDPPLPANYKYKRKNGMFVTDVWDDIRELTSGYFAGDEALRDQEGNRFHKQQAPIALLLRIILTSTQINDVVFDPFAGTGTTLSVAKQLGRQPIGIEIDPANVTCIKNRLDEIRPSDDVNRWYEDYHFTEDLDAIWGHTTATREQDVFNLPLFRSSSP